MARSRLLCLVAAASVGACTLVPGSNAGEPRVAVETTAQAGDATATDAVAAQGPNAGTPIADEVLALWRDPEFQRRFAESYMSTSDVEPTVTIVEQELMQEVSELLAGNQPEPALSRLRSRQGATTSALIDFTIGNLLSQKEQYVEAAVEFEKAVGKSKRFLRAWKNLGFVRMRLGQQAGAARAFAKVVELGGADGLTFGLMAFAHGASGDLVAAEAAYRMASLMEPDRTDWRMGLARTLFQQRRFAEAAALCGTLIDKNPESGELWLLQAQAFVGMNELGKAAENLEIVERLGKATFDSLAMLGDIYVNDGLYELATRAYERAVAKDEKGQPQRAMRAASVLVARNAAEEAVALAAAIDGAYGESLDASQRKELLKLRARIAMSTGGTDEQAQILEQIVAQDPLDGEALILLGQHHARQNEPDKAIFRFEQAAGIESSAPDGLYQHARLLATQGKYQNALPLLRRAQQLKPRDHVQRLLEQVERLAQGR